MALALIKTDHITRIQQFECMLLVCRAGDDPYRSTHHLPNLSPTMVVLPRQTLTGRNNKDLGTEFPSNLERPHVNSVKIGIGKFLRLAFVNHEKTTPRTGLVLLLYAETLLVQGSFHF